ncbi:hypothetical protein N665_0228s0017, partial [Sinapis alba]
DYKAKHFRKSDFLEVKTYQTSSYAWRSIIQTQTLTRKGLKWVIGNGEWVKVWKDSWLPGTDDMLLRRPGAFLYPNLLVKDLFVPKMSTWNAMKIKSLVDEEDVNKILTISDIPKLTFKHSFK